MNGERGSSDERLLEELRALGREVDPVPPHVESYAKAALGWRRIDAELAELLADSALDRESLSHTRSGLARARSVTFRSGDLELDLEISEHDEGLVLLGQLAPAEEADVEVQRDDGSIAAATASDELGRFRLELTVGGRVRLLVRRAPPAPPIETSWVGI